MLGTLGGLITFVGGDIALFGWIPFADRENGAMKALTVVLIGVLLALAGGHLTS